MGDCWENPGARRGACSAFVAVVVSLALSACGPELPELTVVEAEPTEEDAGVVVVTTTPSEPGTDGAFVENPSTTSSSEPAPTTEATASSTTAPPPTTTAPTTAPPTTAAPPPAPPPDPTPSGPAEASVAFVNQKRAENGRGALQVDEELTAMAEAWARQMAADGELRHNPNLNSQMPDHYRSWGENVGYAGEANVIDNGWWTSEGHRNNILNPGYDSIGVAFVEDGNGRVWGVQVFGGH